MAKEKRPALTSGSYLTQDEAGQNLQIWNARWHFIQAVCELVPTFLELLRTDVYPTYARLANGKTDYWTRGWTFATWRDVSDPGNELTPVLLNWAGRFNVQDEQWILGGALQTLANWQESHSQDPPMSEAVFGFRQHCGAQCLPGG